jgi:hypothetical protein
VSRERERERKKDNGERRRGNRGQETEDRKQRIGNGEQKTRIGNKD